MSRCRLAVSFVIMTFVLGAAGSAVVTALPLRAPATTIDSQQSGAKKPGQIVRSKPAASKTFHKLRDVRPDFPAGSPDTPVIISLTTKNGDVVDASAVEGPSDLTGAAIAAARQWRFSSGDFPALLVGFNPAAESGELASQPPVRVGGNIVPPKKTHDVKPVYPDEARAERVQGVVILQVVIAADGAVAEACILRSVPKLDAAAMRAVLQWKFRPSGFPLLMTVTCNFKLDDGSDKGVGVGVRGGIVGGVPGGVGSEGASKVPGAVRVGGGIQPPSKTLDVKPVYPPEAREAGVQGMVVIEATIGADGKVQDAEVLRSVPALDQAALDAVRQWQFTPTIVKGAAVPVIMTVTVNFKLS